MSSNFPTSLDLLPFVRSFFVRNSLELKLDPQWGSASKDYRPRIRQFLVDQITFDPRDLELERTPAPEHVPLSISHCRELGGIFWDSHGPGAPSAISVGFDVEARSRCRKDVMGRVSSIRELDETPEMATLWTAKEAAYKAIPRDLQPASVSQIQIGHWKKLPYENCWQWEVLSVRDDNQGHTPGIVICQNDHCFAFLVKSITTWRLKKI